MSDDPYDHLLESVQNPANRPIQIFVSATFLVILFWMIWAGTATGWSHWGGAIDQDMTAVPIRTATAGAWGDSFGGFNALFGALGFGAVISTLFLQYRSLQEQKREQHIARFEDNFFRLLELLREMRSEIEYTQTEDFIATNSMYVRKGLLKGHDAIEAAYREINHFVFALSLGSRIKKRHVAAQYNNYVHARYEFCFSPYFRIIYTILRRIASDNVLSDDEKANYGNIVRSQMTSFEVGMLAFNATSKVSKDLSLLVEQFRMLKYLPNKRRRVLGDIFPPIAYAARS